MCDLYKNRLNADIKLIQLVEKFPNLFDKREKAFKDKLASENSWTFISNEMKIPASECIHRWTTLRNRFSKERAKVISSGSSAGCSSDWELMKYLKFLNYHVRKRKTFGNIPQINYHNKMPRFDDIDESTEGNPIIFEKTIESDEAEQVDDYNSSTKYAINLEISTQKINSTPKETKNDQNFTPILSETVNILKQLSESKQHTKDSREVSVKCFCDSLFHDLIKMDPKTLRQCKLKILQAIDECSN